MIENKQNILGQFVRITDESKCLKEINTDPTTNYLWPNQLIRNKSCEAEWNRFNYFPKNGHVGEIIAKLVINNSELDIIYIIRTFGIFYVPISASGFEKIDVIHF